MTETLFAFLQYVVMGLLFAALAVNVYRIIKRMRYSDAILPQTEQPQVAASQVSVRAQSGVEVATLDYPAAFSPTSEDSGMLSWLQIVEYTVRNEADENRRPLRLVSSRPNISLFYTMPRFYTMSSKTLGKGWTISVSKRDKPGTEKPLDYFSSSQDVLRKAAVRYKQ